MYFFIKSIKKLKKLKTCVICKMVVENNLKEQHINDYHSNFIPELKQHLTNTFLFTITFYKLKNNNMQTI